VFDRQKSVVGLDLGTRSVKIVELEPAESAPRLVRVRMEELPITDGTNSPDEDQVALAQKLSEMWAEFGAKKKEVVTGIPGRAVMVKKLVLDRVEEPELGEAVRLEAESQIPYDMAEVVFDYQLLSTDPAGKRVEVLLVAAKKESVLAKLQLLAAAGITPSLVDVDSFAIQNALEANHEVDPGEVLILLDVGAGSTSLNIVQGGVPQFVTQVACGGDSLLDVLKQKHGMLESEALDMLWSDETPPQHVLEEVAAVFQDVSTGIDRALAFLRSAGEEAASARIFLSGGCAGWKALGSYLAERNRLPVEVLNPFERIECRPDALDGMDKRRISPQLAVAVGFALRGGRTS